MSQAATIKLGRTYGGVSTDVRQAERRDRLIEAAIAVYGDVGFKNASVKTVCQTAGLTQRYFYEAFANSEALLIAAYNQLNERFFNAIREAGRGVAVSDRETAMMTAFFTGLKQRPREAHLFLVEVRGVSPAVDAVIAGWFDRFGALIAETLGTAGADHLLMRGTVGGLLHMAIAWIEADARSPVSQVVPQALALCEGLKAAGA